MKKDILSSLKIRDVFSLAIPRRNCDFQGWHSSDPLLIESIESLEKFVAIEVGAWKGLSTIAIAQAIKQNLLGNENANFGGARGGAG